jgi:hypothetical protein
VPSYKSCAVPQATHACRWLNPPAQVLPAKAVAKTTQSKRITTLASAQQEQARTHPPRQWLATQAHSHGRPILRSGIAPARWPLDPAV